MRRSLEIEISNMIYSRLSELKDETREEMNEEIRNSFKMYFRDPDQFCEPTYIADYCNLRNLVRALLEYLKLTVKIEKKQKQITLSKKKK